MSLSEKYSNTPLNPEDTAAQILSPITSALKKNNITPERLSKKLNELIDCTKGEAPDNRSQLTALDIGLKLTQAYPAEKIDTTLHIEDLIQALADKRKGSGTGD